MILRSLLARRNTLADLTALKLVQEWSDQAMPDLVHCSQELEAEYLATFKKTVAMHEQFISRLVAHPVFRNDRNLMIFLEYEKDLNVRGKNKKEKLVGEDIKRITIIQIESNIWSHLFQQECSPRSRRRATS